MIKGTILKGIGGFYYVDTQEGLFECRARGIFRKEKVKPFLSIPAALLAELVMVLGYLLFESTALGLGFGAFASVPGNALQGLCGSVGGFLVFFALQKIPSIKRLFQL